MNRTRKEHAECLMGSCIKAGVFSFFRYLHYCCNAAESQFPLLSLNYLSFVIYKMGITALHNITCSLPPQPLFLVSLHIR